jgi:predicted Zn-dependent protease
VPFVALHLQGAAWGAWRNVMSVTPIRKLALASALPLALALSAVVSAPAMAADPTADQVYSAARSGHVDDALTQMQQVLKDHPGSAKAHFVEAELLAKANRLAEARTELAKAEQLQPGLPFVSQHAVTALKAQLAVTSSTGTAGRSVEVQRQGSGFPWIR